MKDACLVEDCVTTAHVPTLLASIAHKTLHVLEEGEALKGLKADWIQGLNIDSTSSFKQALIECRVIKSQEEIDIMKRAAQITGQAHTSLMRAVGQGQVTTERQGQALFQYECFKEGCVFCNFLSNVIYKIRVEELSKHIHPS
jgi:Xaa-Pro dipeptidase